MKILHTSDWHLGKRLGTISRHEEQEAVLDEICRIADAECVHAVLVAGDIFDSANPPVESIQLLFRTLKRLAADGRRAVVAIAGNHDSPDRIEAPDPLARECGILFAGYPRTRISPFALEGGLSLSESAEGFAEIIIPDAPHPLRLILSPYASETRLRSYLGETDREAGLRSMLAGIWAGLAARYCDPRGVNILLAHACVVPEGATAEDDQEDEKPILGVGGAQAVFTSSFPAGLHYAALGHLHTAHAVGGGSSPAFYAGSPLAYAMNDTARKKQVLVIEADPGAPARVRFVPLTQGKRLCRMRFPGVGEAVAWLRDNPGVLVELTMAMKTFLTGEERRQILDSHDGIVDIIPEVTIPGGEGGPPRVNLQRSVEELFRDYFSHVHGQEPNDRLVALFREVTAVEEE
ncbi:MAG: exonuclease subunit SbcD [Bacteroidota bacterium]